MWEAATRKNLNRFVTSPNKTVSQFTSLEDYDYLIQWGSKPFENWKHLKYGLFEGRISNGWAMVIAIVPTIQNQTIQNLDIFVWILNGL